MQYKYMVGITDPELCELVLRFSRSYTIQRCTSATQRSYQQRIMKPLLIQADFERMMELILEDNADGSPGPYRFLEAAIHEGVQDFNCVDSTQKIPSVLCRLLQAVAAKGLAYPLINNPHLLGPLFVELGEDRNGGMPTVFRISVFCCHGNYSLRLRGSGNSPCPPGP